MLLDQPLGNRETQAGAFANTLGRRSDLMKAAENCFVFVLGYADSGIRHAEAERTASFTCLDRDAAAGGSELDGIAQQVVEHLFESQAIRIQEQILGQRAIDLKILGRGGR